MNHAETDTAKPKVLASFFSKINAFQRNLRRKPLLRYVSKRAGAVDETTAVYFQPRYLIIFKVALFFMAARYLYAYHVYAGKAMQFLTGLFKLEQIYRFRFPGDDFFMKVSSALFILILAYFGAWFLSGQVQGLFSGMAIDRKSSRLYYVKNRLVTTSLFIFNMNEIDVIVLHQNILTRLLKLGTMELRKKSGEKILVRSLHNAPQAVSLIAQIKRP